MAGRKIQRKAYDHVLDAAIKKAGAAGKQQPARELTMTIKVHVAKNGKRVYQLY